MDSKGFLPYRFPTPEERETPLHEAEKPRIFQLDTIYQITIAHVVDPNDFYVTLDVDEIKMEKMKDDIGIEASFGGLTAYHPIRDQTTVVVLEVGPKKWVRAKVLSIEENNTCRINMIDTGEIEVIHQRRLKTPPEWTLKIPPFAYHCGMGIVPLEYINDGRVQQKGEGFPWADAVCETLRTLGKYETPEERSASGSLNLHCLMSEESEGMNYVDLVLMPRNESWPMVLVNSKVANWAYPEYGIFSQGFTESYARARAETSGPPTNSSV